MNDLDLVEVIAVVEEALGALRETEAVHGGEEREEEAMALLWFDVTVEEVSEASLGGDGRSGGAGSIRMMSGG